jgi:hypothetical protein
MHKSTQSSKLLLVEEESLLSLSPSFECDEDDDGAKALSASAEADAKSISATTKIRKVGGLLGLLLVRVSFEFAGVEVEEVSSAAAGTSI